MNVDILKCENGWLLIEIFVNRADTRKFVFKNLEELAAWIVEANR